MNLRHIKKNKKLSFLSLETSIYLFLVVFFFISDLQEAATVEETKFSGNDETTLANVLFELIL